MPKLFASEVVVRDDRTGKAFEATIKVNQPLVYKGVALIGLVVTTFALLGVNMFLSGLHSYGAL